MSFKKTPTKKMAQKVQLHLRYPAYSETFITSIDKITLKWITNHPILE